MGGFSLGFLRANRKEIDFQFDLKLLVDSDPTASFTFKKNFPQIPFWTADIGKTASDRLMKLVNIDAGLLDFFSWRTALSGVFAKWQTLAGRQSQQT